MFRELVTRARGATMRLGVEGLNSSDGDDAAAYLTFFSELVEKLEKAATSVDGIVDEECRELLSIVATRVFSNLSHANPGFDFSPVLKPVERACRHAREGGEGACGGPGSAVCAGRRGRRRGSRRRGAPGWRRGL